MSFTVLYHRAVEHDISEAKNWYKNRQKGLEKRFTSEVKLTLLQLSKNPLLFETKYRGVRVAHTKIFPFGVHFHCNEVTKIITILGVFHTSLNPERWENRK
jgi:hypothetical protein